MIYVAPTATIVGDVALEEGVSVWYGTILRGDLDGIAVGSHVNLQDGAVIHTDVGCPTRIGPRVTVGHNAIVHGCDVGSDCIVGMGATVASRAVVGEGSIVAPGAVLPEGKRFPPGSLLAGVPAKVQRKTSDGDRVRIDASWRVYKELAERSLPAEDERAPDPRARVTVDFLEGLEP